jgi:hypothetical protein
MIIIIVVIIVKDIYLRPSEKLSQDGSLTTVKHENNKLLENIGENLNDWIC